jgi:hypothetical protein
MMTQVGTKVRISPRITWMIPAMHIYEARWRIDKRGVNLISDALPFDGLWKSTIAFAYA